MTLLPFFALFFQSSYFFHCIHPSHKVFTRTPLKISATGCRWNLVWLGTASDCATSLRHLVPPEGDALSAHMQYNTSHLKSGGRHCLLQNRLKVVDPVCWHLDAPLCGEQLLGLSVDVDLQLSVILQQHQTVCEQLTLENPFSLVLVVVAAALYTLCLL